MKIMHNNLSLMHDWSFAYFFIRQVEIFLSFNCRPGQHFVYATFQLLLCVWLDSWRKFCQFDGIIRHSYSDTYSFIWTELELRYSNSCSHMWACSCVCVSSYTYVLSPFFVFYLQLFVLRLFLAGSRTLRIRNTHNVSAFNKCCDMRATQTTKSLYYWICRRAHLHNWSATMRESQKRENCRP